MYLGKKLNKFAFTEVFGFFQKLNKYLIFISMKSFSFIFPNNVGRVDGFRLFKTILFFVN